VINDYVIRDCIFLTPQSTSPWATEEPSEQYAFTEIEVGGKTVVIAGKKLHIAGNVFIAGFCTDSRYKKLATIWQVAKIIWKATPKTLFAPLPVDSATGQQK
jgi:hypothetical protein